MKKYISPAVEITAMRAEGVIATSFTVNPDVTVEGGSTDAGQLTNQYGWDASDWSE